MSTRTEPQQRRSRDKRDRLLAAAAGLLQEVPYEEIGTKLIADRAEVSIGSLYRFFPDKDAIFGALLDSWLDRVLGLMDALVADPPPTAGALVDRLVDAYAAFWRAEPGFRQVELGSARVPFNNEHGRRNDDELAERLIGVLSARYGLQPPPQRIALAVNLTEFTINRAFRTNPDGDAWVLDELKILLRRYFGID